MKAIAKRNGKSLHQMENIIIGGLDDHILSERIKVMIRRNEILEIGQIVYLCQDKCPPNHSIITARLISINKLDHYKDAWRAQDVDTGNFLTWHPNKILPIEPITN